MFNKKTLPLTPIDGNAKRVALPAKAEDCYSIPERKRHLLGNHYWKAPKIGLKALPIYHPTFIDFTGQRFGRSFVYNFLGKSKWQMRCDCGNYFIRTAKWLKDENKDLNNSMCEECYHLNRRKRIAFFESNGYYPNEEESYKL